MRKSAVENPDESQWVEMYPKVLSSLVSSLMVWILDFCVWEWHKKWRCDWYTRGSYCYQRGAGDWAQARVVLRSCGVSPKDIHTWQVAVLGPAWAECLENVVSHRSLLTLAIVILWILQASVVTRTVEYLPGCFLWNLLLSVKNFLFVKLKQLLRVSKLLLKTPEGSTGVKIAPKTPWRLHCTVWYRGMDKRMSPYLQGTLRYTDK